MDASKHQIVMDVEEDESLYGEDFSFKLKATFQTFEEIQSFKISFSEKIEEVVDDEESESSSSSSGTPSYEPAETEQDENPTEEEPLTPTETDSWDGWKILLAKLGLDFDLPQPRTDDPNYIPVPPTAAIEDITAEGRVIVKFSKPVFELQDMTTKTIEAGRRLAEKPFLDVYVTPGENSDPELLGLKVTTEWLDTQTI